MAIRRRVVVQGVVQGVGFRYAVAQRATARGVGGWVRNRPDGRVEAAFEGDAPAVDELVRFCREGPRGAVVGSIDAYDETPEGLTRFTVR